MAMTFTFATFAVVLLIDIAFFGLIIYLIVLLIKALRKYLRSRHDNRHCQTHSY